jgi:hypothetical protein
MRFKESIRCSTNPAERWNDKTCAIYSSDCQGATVCCLCECVQTNEALAKKSGDDKKLQMVASRKKKLEDRMGQEKNDKGHRFSRNKCAR